MGLSWVRVQGVIQSGVHVESTVGSLISIIALSSIMQLGGIPAPLKGSCLSVFMWFTWMLMQALQIFTVGLALTLVLFSYVQMQSVLQPCMVEGPFGQRLLNVASSVCFTFQPIVLSKLLVLLLYYHALHAGIRTYQMARNTVMTEREKQRMSRFLRLVDKGQVVIFGPVLVLAMALFVLSGAAVFSVAYTPVLFSIAVVWWFTSALLQGMSRCMNAVVVRFSVANPGLVRSLVLQPFVSVRSARTRTCFIASLPALILPAPHL